MELFTADQIRKWDQYTIAHEPISSIDLMERASIRCVEWIVQHHLQKRPFLIFCGKGNNGGDGLTIGRLLVQKGASVQLYILDAGNSGTEDFQVNLTRLQELPVTITFLQSAEQFPSIQEDQVVVDALYGSGLSRPLEGLSAALVQHINRSKAFVLSIDMPSGLFMGRSSLGNPIIKAEHTLSFQVQKFAFLVAENAPFIGAVHILDIGLHSRFLEEETSKMHLITEDLIICIYNPRSRFAHKGSFGHALLMGGSYGKIGAILLATKACLRTGAGLTTVYLPKIGYTILQSEAPEAMVLTDEDINIIVSVPSFDKFSVVGIGPGLGIDEKTGVVFNQLLNAYQGPLVIDADGLNLLAKNSSLLNQLPPKSILTPHPKEFDRLFGSCANEFERIERAQQKAKELGSIIVLKGHHSLIATPSGQLYFNTTGNAGMAKGGSGDVLTGILTALVAQGYEPLHAALLGVYLHGLSGDLAAREISQESMISSDLIAHIGPAFSYLFQKKKEL